MPRAIRKERGLKACPGQGKIGGRHERSYLLKIRIVMVDVMDISRMKILRFKGEGLRTVLGMFLRVNPSGHGRL